MNHLVLDLEMCNVPKLHRHQYKYASEIIEIGAVLLDDDFHQIATLRQYVHPTYGVLDEMISSLTGITEENIKNAPVLEEALGHMLDWIGNRECKIYAWSKSDYAQFRREIVAKELTDDRIDAFMKAENWIDYQAVFGERFDYNRAIGLSDALLLCEIEAEGHQHDGCDDAINTAKLITLLETNPRYELLQKAKAEVLSRDELTFSLGGLLAGVKLAV